MAPRYAGVPARIFDSLLVAGVYYVTGRLGLVLAIPPGVATPVWPPSGVAFAAAWFRGPAIGPAVFAGSFLVNLGKGPAVAALIALGSTIQALLAAQWMRRMTAGASPLERARHVFGFAGVAAASCTVAPTVGVTTLLASGLLGRWSAYGENWLTWWLGDLAGVFVVAPLTLAWADRPQGRAARPVWVEGALVLVLLCAGGRVIFGGGLYAGSVQVPLAFLVMAVVCWAAFRFGQFGVALSVVAVSAVAIEGTVRGYGPFARRPVNESLLLLQVFVVVTAVLAHVLAAAVGEGRRAEERFRRVVEATPSALLMIDGRGRIALVNSLAERMFGYAREEMIGRPVEMLVPDRLRDRHPGYRDGFLAAPQARPMGAGRDLFALRKDGREIPVEIGLNPLTTAEGPFVLASVIDISERKRAEAELSRHVEELRVQRLEALRHARDADEARRRAEASEHRTDAAARDLARSNEELERFAYVASHDLQEPLRMVSSFMELLRRRWGGKLDAEADKYIHFAVDGAQRMQEMIRDLLRYSRVARQDAPRERVDCGAVLDGACANLRVAIAESGARVSAGPLPVVEGSPALLTQVFQNLIDNAIKYRGAEAPVVRVDATVRDGQWDVSVRDNGIGIDPRHHERIFTIFQRLHERGRYPGSGIGLAVARKIIDRHGGRIWVESAPGAGACFHFTLPEIPAAGAPPAADGPSERTSAD